MALDEAIAKAILASIINGCVQHVNRIEFYDGGMTDSYCVSDWYDSILTVVSFENGKEL